MAAIVGAAGLAPCLAAARAGKRLMLANKEALVVGGQVFLEAVQQGGATLLPVDSEHSAIFQALPEDPASWSQRVDKIILTAPGGPFRTADSGQPVPGDTRAGLCPSELEAWAQHFGPFRHHDEQGARSDRGRITCSACRRNAWPAGDSPAEHHPHFHRMCSSHDASIVAQMGTPDMPVPIAYALSWPQRIASGAATLDFSSLGAMTFESVDAHGHPERFPSLPLVWQVFAGATGQHQAVLNAANEVAVASFLDGRIRFDQIHRNQRRYPGANQLPQSGPAWKICWNWTVPAAIGRKPWSGRCSHDHAAGLPGHAGSADYQFTNTAITGWHELAASRS